ncbi:MAG TPA: YicC/YloC family endoribonuclease [Burkholderiaceae bacterium]|nr:YicC/YloC family endoribonuclease [Burkholderiaceae bacterium]
MIRSMTAFGSARSESEHGSVTVEARSVNSRYLDLSFRLPEDLRLAEGGMRERIGQVVKRGKLDIRANFLRSGKQTAATLDTDYLQSVARQLEAARRIIPDVAAPRLSELLNGSNGAAATFDPDIWVGMCLAATDQALAELQAAREREGQRLAGIMLESARGIADIVEQVERDLPAILAEHQEKLGNKLRDALQAASPEGYSQISGPELSARIAQEASLFSLRIDVAEELARLRSHIAELEHLLQSKEGAPQAGNRKSGSAGKRLDFLFQEMNREANTLGSKASALSVTRAAIDLKLLIEQMREQAQNIE